MVDDEPPVATSRRALAKTVGEPEPRDVGRFRVEPIVRESVKSPDVSHGGGQLIGHRLGGDIDSIAPNGNYVEIAGRRRRQ